MAPRELIDLSLSTDDEAQAKSLLSTQVYRSKSHVDAEFVLLSDDFDSTAHLEPGWSTKPPKRPRLSSPTECEKGHHMTNREALIRGSEDVSTSVITKTKSREKPLEWSDPIIFTSSPNQDITKTRIARGDLTTLSDGSDDSLPECLPRALAQQAQIVSHFSTTTTALIASFDKSPARKRTSRGTRNEPRAREFAMKTGSVLISNPRKEMIESEDVNSKLDKGKTSKRTKLTEAEKDARTQEREKANVTKRERKEKEKEEEKERKRLFKEEKAREKQKAAGLAEVNKSKLDKKTSTPEMIVDLPVSLEGTSVDNQIREFLKRLEVDFTTYESPLPNVIRWRRKKTSRFNEEMAHWEPMPEEICVESHTMCILSAKEFVSMASQSIEKTNSQDLEEHVVGLKRCLKDSSPIYLIEGLTACMRKSKTTQNRAYQAAVLNQADGQENGVAGGNQQATRRKKPAETSIDEDMVEDALLRLQIMHGCLVHHTSATVETAEWVSTFTQHISTIPYKYKCPFRDLPVTKVDIYRNERMNLETSFCMDVGQVKTGDDTNDTFVKMLQEVVRVTAPVAYGIAEKYPNVISLVKGMRRHGPLALEDLPVY